MKRASYREAVAWIAENDDTYWLEADEPIVSVTAALICDLFDVEHDRIVADLRKARDLQAKAP